jgi:hypothetical protein
MEMIGRRRQAPSKTEHPAPEGATTNFISKDELPCAQNGFKAPLITAVVLNWNGYKDTVNCVQSLKQVAYSNLEIIIVDNGSTDGSAEKLERIFPDLMLIKLSQNGGYAAGNNAGIRFALERGAEYVLVLNNDVIVEKDCLFPMVELAGNDTAIGVVTCRAFLQSDHQRIYGTAGGFSRWRCIGAPLPPRLRGRECEVNFISGCILLVKRKVFETVGLFDEKLFMYFEDVEFSRRVGKQFKLAYTPKGLAYHKSGGGDRWRNYTETYLYYTTRNRFWVFRDEPLWYRVYVTLYGILNAFAKSVVIITNLPAKSSRNQAGKRLEALWRGLIDGLLKNP